MMQILFAQKLLQPFHWLLMTCLPVPLLQKEYAEDGAEAV